jgi:hypothetical protein
MKRWTVMLFLAAASCWAEDPTLPTFRTFAGAFAHGSDHDYFVESSLRLPLVQTGIVAVAYTYQESTPFVRYKGSPQAEVLARQQEGEVRVALNDSIQLIGVGGYRSTYWEDTPGFLSAYAVGGGIGSPLPSDGKPFGWTLTGGALLSTTGTRDNWWVNAQASWRLWTFVQDQYRDTPFRAALVFVADAEFDNENERLQPLSRLGPALEILTAFGNRAQLQGLWYYNSNNEFFGNEENAFLFGLNVSSSLQTNFAARSPLDRSAGWLPLVWGGYELGYSTAETISRFEMNVELIDFTVADHLFTGKIWYESREEFQHGDYDNIAYSVTLGLRTPIGLASILSHDDPLIAGADFLHRSDHALNPSSGRVPPGTLQDHGSLNVLPLFSLQTTGWDLPYRDRHIYDRHTMWLNVFDWCVSAGYDMNDNRNRGVFAGQLGLNWDIATVQGNVIYARGIGTTGNETPDWLVEGGVRRPAGKIFIRYDSYGMNSDIARGDVFVFGVGVNL